MVDRYAKCFEQGKVKSKTGTAENRKITQAWAIIKPNGDILLDSSFANEAHAWQIALGWPSDQEIDEAKKNGYRAVFAAVVV